MRTLVTPLLWTGRRSNADYWLLAACGPVLLGAALVGWWLSWLSASTAAFCFLLLAALVARYSRTRSLRIADLVTLLRGLGVCFLAGFALQAWAGGLVRNGVLTMIIMGTLCLTLDGVDGHVARARGEATAFGARFDVETDPALRTPLPYRYSGKVIAVVQAVALLTALAFGLTHGAHWVPTLFLLVAFALLCWSFGRSVIWQLRQS
jgi:phosphatidylglycerophosphate synthase